ncbi:MAG: UDP-N-acetylmuramoyl-tripeptide--D-alanyl-D-alanine ligase [Deltaproteobacteria bacterium]|nr:UDP-N-acetylmuramoyl-tripeptide--D-alanyl-D-alanine ligase [Deltaproteobacteria bacterium]
MHFDSRQLKGGELFVALPGEKVHGHDFLDLAFEKGANLAIVEDRAVYLSSRHQSRLILVPDSLQALWALARSHRATLGARVLGITGSMGKTTTKEMCAALLTQIGQGSYSKKSFNNHLGVPFTLCNADPADRWVVLEMGMNHPGELRELSRMAKPDAVLITNIAPVHIGQFESLSAIADAKCEILDGVLSGGKVLLNGNDAELLAAYSRTVQSSGRKDYLTSYFGTDDHADAQLLEVKTVVPSRLSCRMLVDRQPLTFELTGLGHHTGVLASAAVLAVRRLFPEADLDIVHRGFEQYTPPAMRLNTIQIADRMIIDDTYNSNPEAVKAALQMLKELQLSGKRVGVILGEMRELGSHSEKYHREIGRACAALGPAFLIAVMGDARFIAEEADRLGAPSEFVESPEQIAGRLNGRMWDVLLIKGSRGVALDTAFPSIRKMIEG